MHGRQQAKISLGLTIAIAAIAILAAAVIGGWWWWRENAQRLKESAEAAYVEGERAGKGLDESDCFDRAVERHSDEDNQSFIEALRTNLILRGCLETSSVASKFCNGVPAKSNFIPHATWVTLRCSKLGFNDSYCPQMMGQVAEYCFSESRKAKLESK